MKTIINSSERTQWFKTFAFLACLLFISFQSCQKDELNQDSMLNIDEMSPSELSISGNIPHGKIKDVDGNVYKKIKIGKQWWMAENLKTTRYNNEEPIDYPGEDNDSWKTYTKGVYAWCNNDINSKDIYGGLYNWYAVNTGKLCPVGWHVSSDDEWKILEKYLGMTLEETDIEGLRGTPAGGKLKETGIMHWLEPNFGATNESGFTALPAGTRDPDGSFSGMYEVSCWWTSTPSVPGPWKRYIGYGDDNIGRDRNDKACGWSVRCVKN